MGATVTEVRVRSIPLDKGHPVAVRDTLGVLDLALDLDQPAEDVCAGLRTLILDAINSGRWSRNRPPYGDPGTA
jgi:hypothetical protein